MDRNRLRITIITLAAALACPALAAAQDEIGGDPGADIEGGATEASDVEMGMGGGGSASGGGSFSSGGGGSFDSGGGGGGGGGDGDYSGGGGGGGLRLGLQGRLDALSMLRLADPVSGVGAVGADSGFRQLAVPIITPGVRLVDGKLFLGLGLGFAGVSGDTGGGGEQSQSGFSISPLVSYDLISEASGALALVGWFNFASRGETEDCNAAGMCIDQGDDRSGIGLNLGAQVRGKLSEALAIGTEWGWGFMSGDFAGLDFFAHGIFGTILVEASVGI